jgi:hypothetical protein
MSETQANTTAQATKTTEVETVTMTDSRVVEFAGAKRMLKTSLAFDDGTIGVRLDFRNGQTRTFVIPSQLFAKFAAHGAEQKLGDATAGLKDVEDMVLAVDTLTDRLSQGEWTASREAAATAGGSILAKALAEARPNVAPEKIRNYLAGLSQADKMALRRSTGLVEIIRRLEAERDAKAPAEAKGKGDSLLAGLEG